MPAPILNPDISLALALEEATYTHARLEANPLTAAFASDFAPFFKQWTKVSDQEMKLRTGLVKAAALVAAADEELNEIADAVSQAVLLEVKNDRKAPQYLLYFGAKRPNELKRPILGGQLDTMQGWIPSLLASAGQVLSQLGARLKDAVAKANAAVAAQAAAEQTNRDFRTIGERKALIDAVNALRKATYGKLSELPHANPDKHLPATFAEPFFRHDSGKKPADKPPTSAELTEQINVLGVQIAAVKEQLVKALADEQAAAKAKSDAEAEAAALAQAEKEAAEAAAKVAALKTRKNGIAARI